MPNLEITNVDQGSVILSDAEHIDVVIAFPGADDYVDGTILARKQVEDAITGTADVGNTGDGTVTLASVVGGDIIPLVGDYNLEVVAAVTNGGVLKLVDPQGNTLANDLTMTPGAGAVTEFIVAGMKFTVTDGATDLIVGDKFALAVAADGKVVVFAEDGIGGAQLASMVLTYDVSAAGASNVAARAMVDGIVRREKLIIDGGGTVTDRIVDSLQNYGIIAQKVTELNVLDNQ